MSDADRRIAYYSERVAAEPRLYPAYALLGAAYFDKARETHDPTLLAKARDALTRSQAIQENFEAMKTMAAVCNYAHRFEDALRWARQAVAAMPEDESLVAMMVESYIGSDRLSEAEGVIAKMPRRDGSFYRPAARGRLLAVQRQFDAAREAFMEAAASATRVNEPVLQAWAEVMAAGTIIDSGRIALARPHLEAARKLDPRSAELIIHEAELLEAEGRPEEALRRYIDLAESSTDPSVYARAFELAGRLGRRREAERCFEAARRGFQAAIDAREVFTLGGLARLYAVRGVNLAEALRLAEQNLTFKRDREARETLELVKRRLAS